MTTPLESASAMPHLSIAGWLAAHSADCLLVCVLLVIPLLVWQLRSRWITACANEWLLLVENGKLVKGGIGLTVFKGLNSVVVRFPSFIQKVGFSAEQITKEIQGVRVTGFVVWSIFREGDGPLKAFRYLDGLSAAGCEKANENLARMAESIIRHHVANATISEVITKREMMRDRCKADMGEVVKGWGVWLETVEVTDVRICSGSLFEDLQVEFRQSTKRSAEKMRLDTRLDIQQNELLAESGMVTRKADAATASAISAAKKKLEKDVEESKCQVEMRNKQAETETAMAIHAAECELEKRKKKAEGESVAELHALNLEVENRKRKVEAQAAAAVHTATVDSETKMKKASAEMNAALHAVTVETQLRNRKMEADIEAEVLKAKKQLEQQQELEKLAAETNRLRMEELKADHQYQLARLAYEAERARAQTAAQLECAALNSKQELQILRERLDAEKSMTSASLQRLSVESTREVYKALPLQSVRMVNVTNGGNGGASLDNMLPALVGLGAVHNQIQPALKE